MALIETFPASEEPVNLTSLPAEDIITLARATSEFGPKLQSELQLAPSVVEDTENALQPVIRYAVARAIQTGKKLPDPYEENIYTKTSRSATGLSISDTISTGDIPLIKEELENRELMPEVQEINQRSLSFAARCVLRGQVQAKELAERGSYAQAYNSLHDSEATKATLEFIEHPVMAQLKKFFIGRLLV
jgi:hypothetical protein